jgi:hypothetical protein
MDLREEIKVVETEEEPPFLSLSRRTRMRITRIYADEHGSSHFSDTEIPLVTVSLFPELPPFRTCAFSAQGRIKLFVTPAELRVFDFHTAPERQLAVALSGTVEYETSDGEVHRLAPGSVALVEDTWGRGHITRFAEGEQLCPFIPISADLAAT